MDQKFQSFIKIFYKMSYTVSLSLLGKPLLCTFGALFILYTQYNSPFIKIYIEIQIFSSLTSDIQSAFLYSFMTQCLML